MKLKFLIGLAVVGSIAACTHETLVRQTGTPSRTVAQTPVPETILAEDADDPTPASSALFKRSIDWPALQGQLRLESLVGPYSNAEGAPVDHFIRLAQKSIDIEIYEMADPAVRSALREAINRKVQVRVVEEPKAIGHRCDVWADDGATDDCKEEQKLRSEIVTAGGAYEKFNKAALCGKNPTETDSVASPAKARRRRGPGRCYQHGKVIVIDRKFALISTGNFNSSNLCNVAANPKVCNRDYSYVTRDPVVVATLEKIFEGDLAGQRQDIPAILESAHVDHKMTVSPYSFEPLKALLESAHESIQLQNQYVNPGSGLEDVLMNMARKGVKVEVQLSDLCAFGKPKESNSLLQKRLMFQEMDSSGVKVRMFPQAHRVNGRGGYLHAKAIVVDRRRAWIGSVNGSATSLDVNREYGLFFSNPIRVRALADYMQKDFDDPSGQTWQDSFECRGSRSSAADADGASADEDGGAEE